VAIRRAMCAFLFAVGYNHVSNLNGYRDMKPERYPCHVLDLLWSRDVISHVTIRLPMWESYSWPMLTRARLWRHAASKIMGSRPWFFGGHVTSSVTWPFDSPCGVCYRLSTVTMRLPGTVNEILGLEDIVVTTLTFWGHVTSSVTWPWRHRSRDRLTPHGGFPIGGQWWPCVYLALLVSYKASN